MGWSDRLAWSGETPLDYPDLRPVAALRFDDGADGVWPDAVDGSNEWTVEPWGGSNNSAGPGPWGTVLGLNELNPGTERGSLTLPFFPGLWPSAGRLLMGLWVRQSYTMTFNPLMSTRSGNPVAYLSTYTTGRLRHQVYSASGGLVLDQYEDSPWGATLGWQWVGMLVDFDARTSQLAAVDPGSHRAFIGPVRSLSGAPNPDSTAPLEVFALPGAGYWSGGNVDEVFVAHPGEGFDFAEYVERIRLGTWANGSGTAAAGKLSVTDLAVIAEEPHTFATGAEPVSWASRPEPDRDGLVPYWSTDGGATWQTGELPDELDGLLRWEVSLAEGDVLTGINLRPGGPTLAPIPDQTASQHDTLVIALDATYTGPVTWTVAAVGIAAEVVDGELVISTGWATGDVTVTVALRDQWGRSASRAFTVSIPALPWNPPPTPQYARAPIIVSGEDDDAVAIIDALSAVVVEEVNGEHTLEFSLAARHRHAGALQPERLVELAGEPYRIRRITSAREGRTPTVRAYCEAVFYDLAYAGQVPARDYLQVPAGTALEDALRDTDWTIGTVNVTTRRTYSVQETNPLDMLRTIAKQHGGDLLFDGVNRTVSLVARSGRDQGVAFIYGRGLTESKRVVDTTSLVTRIYARNADGTTIASVNGGKPYVEDFTWTSEVREAVYDFASGVSPWTMLSTAQATLANRARPAFSYEFTVADLSYRSGQELDRFDVGDIVTVVDDELGIRETQRIVRVEHDIARPWASKIVLSAKLRETGTTSGDDEGSLTTGSMFQALDVVPFNLLRNGRFDNGLAHWAASGVSIVPGNGTGDYAVRFQGRGVRWIEQTIHPDNRDVYSLSLNTTAVTGGSVPPLAALVTVEYEDGSKDTIPVELA